METQKIDPLLSQVQVRCGCGTRGGEHRVTRGSILYQCSGSCCYFYFFLCLCLFLCIIAKQREEKRREKLKHPVAEYSEGLRTMSSEYSHVHAYKSRYRDKASSVLEVSPLPTARQHTLNDIGSTPTTFHIAHVEFNGGHCKDSEWGRGLYTWLDTFPLA